VSAARSAVVGEALAKPQLVLKDGRQRFARSICRMEVLLGKPPKMHREVVRVQRRFPALNLTDVRLQDAVVQRVGASNRGEQTLFDHHR
jgi:phosphoribosylformylglycinamidine synthase